MLYGVLLLCCCTVRCCCCVVVLCCTVVLLLWAPSSSYTTGLTPSVVTLQLQHRVVTVGCCTAVLHCCAALLRCCAVLHCCVVVLCCTVALLCCAALLRSVRRPLRVTTPSCYTSGLVPSVVTEGIPLRDRRDLSHRSKTGHRPTIRFQSVARERVTVGF